MSCTHSEIKDFSKCSQCGEINLPQVTKPLNFFEIFDLKPGYNLDLDLLNKRFYELSRVLHPDRFQKKGIDELMLSTHWSAILNKAFKTLKDSEERAFYLLELAHLSAKNKGALPPDLAEDYFDLQELLEENKNKGAEVIESVRKFHNLLKSQLDTNNLKQDQIFKEWEDSGSPLDEKATKFFTKAAEILQQKAYLRSMSSDLEKKWL